jgi:hypothetical protein
LSTPVEKSTQCQRAREVCEIAKIREIMVTKLQEKGRPVKKRTGINLLIGKEKNGHRVKHGSEQTDKRRIRKGYGRRELPAKICSRMYLRLRTGSDVS